MDERNVRNTQRVNPLRKRIYDSGIYYILTLGAENTFILNCELCSRCLKLLVM